tara:strand:+ start:3360 stop:4046 length:687 start_codon:yes stop_codon:yes gene_type:complete
MNDINSSLIKGVNLMKSFNSGARKLPILKGVDFDIKSGQSIAIMGDSGSGKSTLLNILSGLETMDSGSMQWKEEQINKKSLNYFAKKRVDFIGFIFQSFHLIPDMNVYENLILSAKISSSLPDVQIKDSILDLLERVDLQDSITQSVETLSGGEKQRVAIVRALLNDPSVIFADEPTGNLDDQSSATVFGMLLDLVKEKNKSLILVTHNKEFCNDLDRTMVLEDGFLV